MGRARLRRLAVRYGLDPDGSFQLIGLAVGDRSEPADTDERLARVSAIAGPPSAAERAGAGLSLPQVLGWRGWLVVIAQPGWAGMGRLRDAIPGLVVERPWTAIVAPPVSGIAELPTSLTVLTDAPAAPRAPHRGVPPGAHRAASGAPPRGTCARPPGGRAAGLAVPARDMTRAGSRLPARSSAVCAARGARVASAASAR